MVGEGALKISHLKQNRTVISEEQCGWYCCLLVLLFADIAFSKFSLVTIAEKVYVYEVILVLPWYR